MDSATPKPDSARSNLLLFCGAPVAIALALGAIAGGFAFFSDSSKADARAACEQVAMLRGDATELRDVKVRHTSGDRYEVTMTVTTPGLDDEAFTGIADKSESGDYVCVERS